MIAARLAWEDEAAPLIENLQRFNVPANAKEIEVLEREPHVDTMLAFALVAYREVATCRQIGFGVGPIPVTAIDAYFDRQVDREGLDRDLGDHLKQALLYADAEWLKTFHDKPPKPSAPKKGNRR